MKSWNLSDAKAQFSELVKRAHTEGPQRVTKRGKDSVVVLAVKDFERLSRRRTGRDLVEFLRKSPLAEVPSKNFGRQRDADRKCRF